MARVDKDVEWVEFTTRLPEVEYFELEEDVPTIRRPLPRHAFIHDAYNLHTYEQRILPKREKYKSIAARVKELMSRYNIHRILTTALMAVAIMAVRKNMIGSIACLKNVHPSQYIASLCSRYCEKIVNNADFCNEFRQLCYDISYNEYRNFDFSVCSRLMWA